MYRWATEADQPLIESLWKKDFEHHEPYFSWYFANAYRPERTLCDFEDGQLAANLQLAPYRLALRGAELDVQYYVGVITDPAFRGQGRGHALLRHTEQLLRRQDCAAALFYTDIPAYYMPLGYRHCYKQQVLRLPSARWQDLASAAQPGWRTLEGSGEWPLLDDIYRQMCSHYDGYIRRSANDWHYYLGEQICEGAVLRLLPQQAYLIAVPEQQQLRIYELGFVNQAGLQAALAEAGRLAESMQAVDLRWDAPADLPQRLPQLAANGQSRPFVMARLLDWPQVLCAIHYPPELSCRVSLAVEEDGCSTTCHLQIAAGQAELLPQAAAAPLCLSIAALTRLVFGDADWQQEAGNLTQQQKELLQQCWPPLNRWINEYT